MCREVHCSNTLNVIPGRDNFASEYLAEDFQFVAPIIGPLDKEEFLRAFGSFKIKDAVPDLKDNAWL